MNSCFEQVSRGDALLFDVVAAVVADADPRSFTAQQVANVARGRGGKVAEFAPVRVRTSNGQVALQGQAHRQTS